MPNCIKRLSKPPRSSQRLDRLEFKQDQKINQFAHEASKRSVELALSYDIATIVKRLSLERTKVKNVRVTWGKGTIRTLLAFPIK